MKTIKFWALIGFFLAFTACNDDDTESPNNPTESPTVNDAVMELTEIFTSPENQVETDSRPRFVVHNDKIYIAGFTYTTGIGHHTELWEYNPSTNSYEEKAPGCTSCSWEGNSISFFSDTNRLYHINFSNDPDFEYYQPSTNQWGTVNTDLPNSIQRKTQVIAIQNKAYFLGGVNDYYGNDWYETDSFSYFNTQNNHWVNLAPYVEPLFDVVMVYDGANSIYAFGGLKVNQNGGSESIKKFQKYSISQNQWESLPDISKAMGADVYGPAVQFYNNRFIVIANIYDYKIYIYDTQEGIWTDNPYTLNFSPTALLKVGNELFVVQTIAHSEVFSHKFHKLTISNLPN